jgi:chemotaxis protein MotB
MADEEVPIIIVKKSGGHGGHHGGAWKIAYADFVTAMMAFFMVMWLVNSADVTTKQSIASYFRRPGMFDHGHGTPLEMGTLGILSDSYAPPKPQDSSQLPWQVRDRLKSEDNESIDKPLIQANGLAAKESDNSFNLITDEKIKPKKSSDQLDFIKPSEITNLIRPYEGKVGASPLRDKLAHLSRQFNNFIKAHPELEKALGKIEFQVEDDGIIIDIMDTAKSSMFAAGSARVLPTAYSAFKEVLKTIEPYAKKIEIRGHTDAAPFSAFEGYSNWELSLARANEARKLLFDYGVSEEVIAGVVGKASNELKSPENPSSPANRRITLKLLELSDSSNYNKTEKEEGPKTDNKLLLEEKFIPLPTPISTDNLKELPSKDNKKNEKISVQEILKESKKNSKLRLPKPKNQYPEAPPEIFSKQPVLGSKDIF